MTGNRIRVGSRESRLAVIQAQQVMDAIRRTAPELELELVTMKTSGDRIQDRTLEDAGGKGLFVRELDEALLDGRVDLCVHSCKDLPMELPDGLETVAFPPREDPRDVLVLSAGKTQPDAGLPVGCASRRRALQWAELFPELPTAPVRGNIQTRLDKLDSGTFSALILAAAGLKRLGLEARISKYFTPEEMLPAAGQGALAVTARQDAGLSFLGAVNDPVTARRVEAERAFVRALGGGCSSPVAAYATVEDGMLRLTGMDESGRRGEICGAPEDGAGLGRKLARRMRGGDET